MDTTPKERTSTRSSPGDVRSRVVGFFKDRKGRAKIRVKVARVRAGNLGHCKPLGRVS